MVGRRHKLMALCLALSCPQVMLRGCCALSRRSPPQMARLTGGQVG